jgi:GH18 family chitinase
MALITSALNATEYLRHFDLAEMAKYVNWFNLKSYDMHGPNGGDDGWRDLKVQTHSNLTGEHTCLLGLVAIAGAD